MSSCATVISTPSERRAITYIVIASARETTSRHSQIVSTTMSTISGQPKNAFSSVRFIDTSAAASGAPAIDCVAKRVNAAVSLPAGPCSSEWKLCGPKNCQYSGNPAISSATTAPMPTPLASGASMPRISPRRGIRYATANTMNVSAKMASGSSPSRICHATSSPRKMPLRTGRSPWAIWIVLSAMNGSTNSTTKFGCALPCEIIGGANPQNAPPIAAAVRFGTRWRENTQYQPIAVPASPAVSTIAQVSVAPKVSVSGARGMLRPNIAAFAAMLTPSG